MPLQCRHIRDMAGHISMAAYSFVVQKQGDPK